MWSWGLSLFGHYQGRRAVQHAAMADAAPPAEHPVLGLGGRSIELSIGRGLVPDPGAFELAAADLHGHRLAGDVPDEDLRAAGRWLIGLWPAGVGPASLAQLRRDLEVLTH